MEDNPPDSDRRAHAMNIPLTPLRFFASCGAAVSRQNSHRLRPERFTYEQFGERAGVLPALCSGGRETGRSRCLPQRQLPPACWKPTTACWRRAVLLPLNIRLAPSELGYVLNDAGATILFIEKQFIRWSNRFAGLFHGKNVHPAGRSSGSAVARAAQLRDSACRATSHRADIALIDENALAEIFYTSGTSANPKGVMLTHRNVYLHALHVCLGFHAENRAVELHTIPLFHANGWGVAHFLTMLGGKHVMIQRFDPKEVFRLIEEGAGQCISAWFRSWRPCW